MASIQRRIQILLRELHSKIVLRVHQRHRYVISGPSSKAFQDFSPSGESRSREVIEAECDDRTNWTERHLPSVKGGVNSPAQDVSCLLNQAHNWFDSIESCTTMSMIPSSGTSRLCGNTRRDTPSSIPSSCSNKSAKTFPEGALRRVLR